MKEKETMLEDANRVCRLPPGVTLAQVGQAPTVYSKFLLTLWISGQAAATVSTSALAL